MDWFHVAHFMVHWWLLLSWFRFHKEAGNFLTGWMIISFLRSTVICKVSSLELDALNHSLASIVNLIWFCTFISLQKMDATCSSEMLLTVYKIICHHNTEDHILNFYHRKSLKSCILWHLNDIYTK